MKTLIAALAMLLAGMPSLGFAQTTDDGRLRDALAAAEHARDEAAAALAKANEAIELLRQRLPAPPPTVAPPAPATSLVTPRRGQQASEIPACDAVGKDSATDIARYMTDMSRGRQKKEASYDPNEPGANKGLNAFVYYCLGLTKATDYESTTNLSAQFTGIKGGDQIDAVLTRVTRGLKIHKEGKDSSGAGTDDELSPTYTKIWGGGFAKTGSDGNAQLVDLTTSNFDSGVGLSAGIEFGRMPATRMSKIQEKIRQGLAKARRECIAEYGINDPLTSGNATTEGPTYALDALAKCSGANLALWLKDTDRSNSYWTDIVSPWWGYGKDKVAETFWGLEGRYAFQDLSYRPVIDPKTNMVITTTLPDEIKLHPETYSFKIYGGFNRRIPAGDEKKTVATYGLTGSLSYRREVAFIGGPDGKTVCQAAGPGTTFQFCDSGQQLSAPYDTKGFIAGLELNLQAKRFWYLPPVGLSPRVTYAFDTKRFGIEVPLFLFTDEDGKLNSGVKYTCNLKGRTPEGFELKSTCNFSLFVGTSFQIRNTP